MKRSPTKQAVIDLMVDGFAIFLVMGLAAVLIFMVAGCSSYHKDAIGDRELVSSPQNPSCLGIFFSECVTTVTISDQEKRDIDARGSSLQQVNENQTDTISPTTSVTGSNFNLPELGGGAVGQ